MLDAIFEFITMFGEEIIMFLLITFVFWCVNKKLGYWLCWCVSLGNILVNSVKGVVKAERPIGYEGIRTLREHTATSYSFPSGHTQAATNLYYSLARAFNKKIFWIVAAVLPVLVGVSRLYLGVHWPADVVCGYAIGCIIPLAFWKLFNKFSNRIPLLFFISTVIFIPFCLMTGDVYDFWKSMGFGIGFAVASYIETKYINFEIEGVSFKKKLLRFVGGIILLVAVYYGMKLALPKSNIVGFVRYLCVPLTAIALWPAIFKKFKF